MLSACCEVNGAKEVERRAQWLHKSMSLCIQQQHTYTHVHACAQITTILLALERSFPFETVFIRRLVTAMLLNLGICAHLGSKLVSVVLETAHLTQCLAAIPAIQFNSSIT